MKSFLLFILLTFQYLLGYSQNYLNETAHWKQSYSFRNSTGLTNCISNRYFNGDTIISGKNYYLLFYTDVCIASSTIIDSFGNPITTYDTTETISFITFIREANKRIYSRDFFDNETIIYNFDVNDNTSIDSVVYDSKCATSANVKILNHDTVCIGTIKRKSWNISQSPFPLALKIIEGVGPGTGFLAPICKTNCVECKYALVSFSLNGDTLYMGNCSLTSTQFKIENSTKLYPNPVADYLFVESSKIIRKYLITDINGKEITKAYSSDKLISIENKNLANGIYIIKLHFDDGVLIRKFIKLNQ